MSILRHILQRALLAAALLPLTACATEPQAKPGRVLEAGSNKPIAGAIVIARWKGFMPIFPADGRTLCYHVESAMTDAEGVYRIPAWQGDPQHANLLDKEIFIDAYKPGYVRSQEYYKQQSYRQGIELMEVFKGAREERLKYLMHMSGIASCDRDGDKNILFAVQKALYQEANRVAVTPQDKDSAQWIRRRAALIWSESRVSLTDSEIEALIRNDIFLSEQLK